MQIREHQLQGDAVTAVDTPNRGGPINPEYLVMHFTAGRSAQGSVEHFRRPQSKASAHLVIGRDGKVWQVVPFNRKAWHAGVSRWDGRTGLNERSIGIELDNAGKLQRVGDRYQAWFGAFYPENEVVAARHKNEATDSFWHAYTEPQIDKALEIGRLLVERYELRDVLGHDDIASERKVDPGPAFPMASFRSSLLGRSDDDPPGYVVTAALLNIRSGPGTGNPTVHAPLPRGTRLALLEMRAEWARVAIEEGAFEGWVKNDFIRKA